MIELELGARPGLSRQGGRCRGRESVEKNAELPAGCLVPIGRVRQRLRKQSTGDDDVRRRDIGTDDPTPPASVEYRLERCADPGSQLDTGFVEGDRSAVKRKDQFITVLDDVVNELAQALDRREVAGGSLLGQSKDETVGSLGKRSQERLASRKGTVERGDPDAGISRDRGDGHFFALALHGDQSRGQHTLAVGGCVAAKMHAIHRSDCSAAGEELDERFHFAYSRREGRER